MIEAFYIELKFYHVNDNGYYSQMDDSGSLPIVYRALSKALKRTERIIGIYTGIMGYSVITPNENHPCKRHHCHYACTLATADSKKKVEIRLYSFMMN